jgi:hypothetical protein
MINMPSLAASCMDRLRIGLADGRADGMRVTSRMFPLRSHDGGVSASRLANTLDSILQAIIQPLGDASVDLLTDDPQTCMMPL